jgi:hypothetical protein
MEAGLAREVLAPRNDEVHAITRIKELHKAWGKDPAYRAD